ncbi:MAG: IS200/IS605 family transposase [Bacteroidota bacterium]
MAHSSNNIWVHMVFCTKYRANIISPELEVKLYQEIRHQFVKLGCRVLNINGYTDHVHVLFLQSPEHSIREIARRVKGASSYAIKRDKQLSGYFSWATGYYTNSVSEQHLDTISHYIDKQKEHHTRR